ncbi:MAG TPA: tetratricopeptide repeat protein [Pirellulales bacterium]|nr:tetratricopeptide repeat protein [Pirellulales bacterium]
MAPRFVYDTLLSPWRELLFVLGVAQDELEAAALGQGTWLRRVRRLLYILLYACARPLVAIGGEIVGLFWSVIYAFGVIEDGADATRAIRLGLLRHALPVLAAAMLLVAGAVWIFATTESCDFVEYYKRAATVSVEAGDDRLAWLCFDRLAQLQPVEPLWRYEAALIANSLGDSNHCAAQMRAIADLKSTGYARAHFWQAEQLLSKTALTLGEARDVWRHLEHGLKTAPDDPQAHLHMTRLLINLGCFSEAEPHLAAAASLRPDLLLVLANVHLANGRRDEARTEAALACKYLTERLGRNAEDRVARDALARAYLILDDYAQAIETLEAGRASENTPAVRRQIGEIYVRWADADLAGSADYQGFLDRLSMALSVDPSNLAILTRLIEVRNRGDKAAVRAGAYLDSLRLDDVPPAGHVMLGTNALERGLPIVARRHYEEALRRQPDLAEASNNLAWLLSHAEPLDLDRALSLVESALQAHPHHPTLLETRGHVYVQLERWEDARRDLETIRFLKRDDAAVNESLAMCYEHLGLKRSSEPPSQ